MPSFRPTDDPVARITASYFACRSDRATSLPSSTFANKRKFSVAAIFSKTFETVLIFG